MKTINLIKITLVVLLGITINANVQADTYKYLRHSHLFYSEFTPSSSPVEDWMFESEYLSEESPSTVEPWMMETDYLGEETPSPESWMFSETHLTESESGGSPEPWMFESGYLSR